MAEPSVATGAVFLSYASQDIDAAARVCEALRAAGVEVWFDQSELRGGDAWDSKIKKQIHECALFIPLISAHTNARSEGYFRREWKLAVRRLLDMADDAAFLVPVVIDGTREDKARVPEDFLGVQWTKLPGGETPPEFAFRVRQLLDGDNATLHAPIEDGTGKFESSIRTQTASVTQKGISHRWRVGLALTALLLGIGGSLFWYFQRASDLHAAQQPPASRSVAAPDKTSIAVLAFADMSEKKDQEYFADGMAEEILDLLEKIPGLKVIGRTSSFQFKSQNVDLRTIGEKLGAAYLVEGSVRKSQARIRVSAQLIDAASGAQVWADSYDREFGDVLNLQDQVATGIARALQMAVVADDTRPRRQLQSTEAYTYYLRGRAALDRGDEASLQEAVDDLEQALALDPNFTRAAESLALAHLMSLGTNGVTSREGWPAIESAVRRTLKLDPNSALAHAILGLKYATSEYDWPAAKTELRQALAQDTRDPVALYHCSWLAFDLGEHEQSLRLQRLSVSIDPLNPDGYQNGGIIHYMLRNFDAAEKELRESMRISPTFTGTHWYLGQIFLLRGDAQAALREMQADSPSVRDFGLSLAYHALGRKADSDAALARATRDFGNEAPMNVAIVHAYRGERDQAFAWLERAVDERDLLVGHKLLYEPKLDALRGDPRYKALLGKMNLTKNPA